MTRAYKSLWHFKSCDATALTVRHYRGLHTQKLLSGGCSTCKSLLNLHNRLYSQFIKNVSFPLFNKEHCWYHSACCGRVKLAVSCNKLSILAIYIKVVFPFNFKCVMSVNISVIFNAVNLFPAFYSGLQQQF